MCVVVFREIANVENHLVPVAS